jgi:nucleotide-binding universal stress UspA family protein
MMDENLRHGSARREAPRSILFATDLSCRCDRALDRALMLAAAWNAKLHVLHVMENDEPDHVDEQWPRRSARTLAERQLRDATCNRGIEAGILIEHGEPADAILRKAAELDSDLIVTGIARSGTMARSVLGTTVERLVHRAPMPVLVVKARPRHAYRKLAVASDFSDSAANALREAVRLFSQAHVSLVHAYRVPFEGFISREANEGELLADAQRECAAFLSRFGASPAVVAGIDCLIRYGIPEVVIGAYVWDQEIELAVMGTHGRGGRFSVLMGSTAERLLACLPCDVLVVREPRAVPVGDTSATACDTIPDA